MSKLIGTIFLVFSSVFLHADMLDVKLVSEGGPCIKMPDKMKERCKPWESLYGTEIRNPFFFQEGGEDLQTIDGKKYDVYFRGLFYDVRRTMLRKDEMIAKKDCKIIDFDEIGGKTILTYQELEDGLAWKIVDYNLQSELNNIEGSTVEKLVESDFSALKDQQPKFNEEKGKKIMGAYRYKKDKKECIFYHLRTLSQ